ncbi:MAG: ATP-binding protein [Pseudomonadales bacterium]
MTESAFLEKVSDTDVKRIAVNYEHDVSLVTNRTYDLASHIGFKRIERTMIATAASELANNIIFYAQRGTMTLKHITLGEINGIEITSTDLGPGINDIDLALQDEYSTGGSLGLGLPGAKRLMHEFHFDEQREQGTKIIIRRWL